MKQPDFPATMKALHLGVHGALGRYTQSDSKVRSSRDATNQRCGVILAVLFDCGLELPVGSCFVACSELQCEAAHDLKLAHKLAKPSYAWTGALLSVKCGTPSTTPHTETTRKLQQTRLLGSQQAGLSSGSRLKAFERMESEHMQGQSVSRQSFLDCMELAKAAGEAEATNP
eukprot:1243457-Amphidinium_carterae.1